MAPKSFLCEHGECLSEDTPITISVDVAYGGERKRFCSFTHLAQWARQIAKDWGEVPDENARVTRNWRTRAQTEKRKALR